MAKHVNDFKYVKDQFRRTLKQVENRDFLEEVSTVTIKNEGRQEPDPNFTEKPAPDYDREQEPIEPNGEGVYFVEDEDDEIFDDEDDDEEDEYDEDDSEWDEE